MSTHHPEDPFVTRVRTLLEQSVTAMDASTVSELRQSRERALDAAFTKRSYPRWMKQVAFASVAVLALGLWLLIPSHQGIPEVEPLPRAMAENLDILMAEPGLDFYADLEFYEWLEDRETQSG